MSNNPYEAPNETNDGATPGRPPGLDENTKEFLGIAKDDFWYYPGFLLLVFACFLSSAVLVWALFAISTVFLLVFLAKSYPKYLRSNELAPVTRVYGLFGNLTLIVLQIIVVVVKTWFLWQ